MNASFRARSTGIVALLLSGLLAGCNDEVRPANVVATLVESSPYPGPPAGSAAAKGAELTAVATVRAWIDARNQAVRTGDSTAVDDLTARDCDTCEGYLGDGHWAVGAARVTRHTVRSATVAVHITTPAARPRERVALEFGVGRVAGTSVITTIARVP